MEYEKKLKFNDLCKTDQLALLKECFLLIGKNISSVSPEEVDLIWREVCNWQGSIWVETFREAFSAYQVGAIEIEKFNPTISAMTVSKIQKAYREKTYGKTAHIKQVEPQWVAPPDVDYYTTLMYVMRGEKSPKAQQNRPQDPAPPGNMIPAFWDWAAVYRHMRVLNECNVSSTFDGQKAAVKMALRLKFPDCTDQLFMLPPAQTKGGIMDSLKGFFNRK